MPTNFRDALVKAMKRACDDMLRFTGEPAKRINAEYLCTVSVAKEFDRLNGYYGDPYRIYLEKKAQDFARDCLHPVKFGKTFKSRSMIRRTAKPKLSRPGRIDVALYEDVANNSYLGYQPVCAVELKGFNPSRSRVLADLKRNLEYFSLQGNTGGSVLGTALFGALHAWPKVGSEIEEETKASKLRDRYVNWLSELPNTTKIRRNVTVHNIRQDLLGEVVDEGDYEVLYSDTIHNFVGIVVEFCADET